MARPNRAERSKGMMRLGFAPSLIYYFERRPLAQSGNFHIGEEMTLWIET